MNIILASDDNFVQHCCVTMVSILTHNKDVNFYLLTEGLKKNNEAILLSNVEKYGGTLHFCKVSTEIVESFPLPKEGASHITIATYYRLLVCELLPQNIDKAIYMDCDIIVRGSLLDLWNYNIEDKAIGAVFQPQEEAVRNNSYELLEYSSEYGYFNAGVLLINLKYWRSNNLTRTFLDYIKQNYSKLYQHDQDVLNAVLHNNVVALNNTWNCTSLFFSKRSWTYPSFINYRNNPDNPTVVHFVSKPKCWDYGCKTPYKDEYFVYLDKTSFKGWRPKFNLMAFYHYKLIPFIVEVDFLKIRNLIPHKHYN